MAVTPVQSATFATGGSLSASKTVTLGVAPTNGNTLLLGVAWDANPVGGGSNVTISSVSGGLALQANLMEGNVIIAFYRLTGTIAGLQSATVNFSGSTFASAFYVEASGANSVIPTLLGFSTFGTNQVVGNSPTSWAPTTGDLPYGFFAARDAATVAAQGGWTEVANLNNTGGQYAQLEVQQGPATAATPQNVTAQAAWTGSPSDTNNLAALVILSSSSPYALISQDVAEIISQDTANAQVSQVAVETVGQDTANAHVSQEAVELVSQDTAFARVSQWVVELIVPLPPRVSQFAMEVLGQDTTNARISQVVVEILWSSQGARRRVADEEWFML